MGVEGVASFRIVQRVLKVALCIAKHMEEENDAYLLAVQRVLRGAHHYVKDMVGVSDVCLMAVGYALRVFTEARTSVLPMEVGRGALFLGAQRVHVAALIAVSSMVVGSDVRLKTAARVPKEAPTSAKPMGEGNAAVGVMENVKNLLGGEVAYVQPTAAWFTKEKTSEA